MRSPSRPFLTLLALGALGALAWPREGRAQVVVVGEPAYTIARPVSFVVPATAVYETSAVTYAAPVVATTYAPVSYVESLVPTAYVPAAYVTTGYVSTLAPTSYVVPRRGLFGPRYRVYNVWP